MLVAMGKWGVANPLPKQGGGGGGGTPIDPVLPGSRFLTAYFRP